MNPAFAIGFGIMFIQCIYLDYKRNQYYKNQLERFKH